MKVEPELTAEIIIALVRLMQKPEPTQEELDELILVMCGKSLDRLKARRDELRND